MVRLRRLSSLGALAVLGAAMLAVLNPIAEPPRLSLVHQSQALLAQADETVDAYQAHALLASALELAQRATSTSPAGPAADLIAQANGRLNQIDRVVDVSPAMAVWLGPSGGNVVDLAVGDDALYTLDVVEGSVRAFSVDGRDQQPTPGTLLLRTGAPIGGGPRRLATPVAMRYLSSRPTEPGMLAIVDQARSVVQVGGDGSVNARALPGTDTWRELGALGSANGHLLVLDSGARRLLDYSLQSQRLADPPRLVLDGVSAPGLAFEKAAEIVGQGDTVFLRMDDGTLHRFDPQGGESVIAVRPPDGRRPILAGMAPDRVGGLYLADPANARILQTTADGQLLRQLRDAALAGVRQIQSSPDGRRLYGLVASGVLEFDIPDAVAP
jgi:hypothetical protein